MQQKISISYAPRSLLQKLLMPFYDRTTLIFGLSERVGLILDQCARAQNSEVVKFSSRAICKIRDYLEKYHQQMAFFKKKNTSHLGTEVLALGYFFIY